MKKILSDIELKEFRIFLKNVDMAHLLEIPDPMVTQS